MPIGPEEGRLAPVRYPTLNPTVVALNKDALWWICVSCASTLRRRDDPDYLLRPPVLGRGYAPKRRDHHERRFFSAGSAERLWLRADAPYAPIPTISTPPLRQTYPAPSCALDFGECPAPDPC